MRKRILTALLGFVTVFALAAPTAEGAALYTINISDFSGGTATLHAPGTLANNLLVELGSVVITGSLGTFESYCVDLQHYITPGTYTTSVDTMDNWNNTATPVHASLGGGAASWLYLTYAASAVGHNDQRAALSMAIWNSLYNNVYNVTTANSGFWVTNVSKASYVTQANAMLSSLQQYQGPLPTANWLRTTNLPNQYSQDFIAAVPEPGTLTLLGVGCFSAFFARRRMMKTKELIQS
jgi:hypothetical protein